MTPATTVGSAPRRAEQALLVLAGIVVVGAYTTLAWSRSPNIPTGTITYGAVLFALAAVAHLTIRYTAPKAGPVLLPVVFLLNGLGLVLVRRVDFATEGSTLAVAQTTWTAVGIGVFAATLLFVRDTRRLARYAYTFGLLTLGLLLLPLVPGLGERINGAQLWITFADLTFQPGEIAKLTMVVFLTGYLERKRALLSVATRRVGPLLLPEPRHLAPVLLAAGGALLIQVAQRDLGSSLLFFGVFLAMLYIATGRAAYPALGGVAFAAGAYLAYLVFDHVQLRYQVWLDPWSRLNDEGYQIAQAMFAFGTGGVTGTGLGLGRPGEIPFAATDAIFAVIGEELGMLGATAVLLAYLLIIGRGFHTALAARDEAGTLLAAGLTTILALQVFVIVGGITRLIPLTGITLPFVSYGGSSLVANYILLALLLRVSHESRAARDGSAAS